MVLAASGARLQLPGACPGLLFLWGSEGNVRDWQWSLSAPLRPPGPGCFYLARPRFWLCDASGAPTSSASGLELFLLDFEISLRHPVRGIVGAKLDAEKLWRYLRFYQPRSAAASTRGSGHGHWLLGRDFRFLASSGANSRCGGSCEQLSTSVCVAQGRTLVGTKREHAIFDKFTITFSSSIVRIYV